MLVEYLLLCGSALVAGAVNAIAGGGTLLTFPVLYAALGSTGPAAVAANATSTVALVPGAFAALAGYWQELQQERRWALTLIGPSLAGGLLGSLLLVWLPSETFATLVPWLILTAALLFALQPTIARWAGVTPPQTAGAKSAADLDPADGAAPHAGHRPLLIVAVLAFQFLVAVYGGYFGAGIGILMLSALAIMGMEDIHRMNAVKTLLNLTINGTSVLVFATSGLVHWRLAGMMAASSIVGGFVAARWIKRVNKRVVRMLIVSIGFSLAAYSFYREFLS